MKGLLKLNNIPQQKYTFCQKTSVFFKYQLNIITKLSLIFAEKNFQQKYMKYLMCSS